jgi:hypothetical protein
MLFNFGDQPWKFKPVGDYIGFNEASAKNVVPNSKSGSNVAERKIVNNAPQALIIEVTIKKKTCFYSVDF